MSRRAENAAIESRMTFARAKEAESAALPQHKPDRIARNLDKISLVV
jgi:hypothetical protein